jgi:hypothetical protein
MSHVTKNQLHMTFANDRISTGVKGGWGGQEAYGKRVQTR